MAAEVVLVAAPRAMVSREVLVAVRALGVLLRIPEALAIPHLYRQAKEIMAVRFLHLTEMARAVAVAQARLAETHQTQLRRLALAETARLPAFLAVLLLMQAAVVAALIAVRWSAQADLAVVALAAA